MLEGQNHKRKIMERQNPEFQDFGAPKSWIQYSGILKSWIQDFWTTQSCVHVYPEFMVFDFEIFELQNPEFKILEFWLEPHEITL